MCVANTKGSGKECGAAQCPLHFTDPGTCPVTCSSLISDKWLNYFLFRIRRQLNSCVAYSKFNISAWWKGTFFMQIFIPWCRDADSINTLQRTWSDTSATPARFFPYVIFTVLQCKVTWNQWLMWSCVSTDQTTTEQSFILRRRMILNAYLWHCCRCTFRLINCGNCSFAHCCCFLFFLKGGAVSPFCK